MQRRKLLEMSETVSHFKEVSGIKLLIKANVYSPGTDTYLLANTIKINPGDTALDLCTGTGVIAIKMALLGAESILGIDLNPKAVENANENKKLAQLNNITFRQGNMFEGVDGKFDVITINPPYTDQKPCNEIEVCFFDEGHKYVKNFFKKLRQHLNPGGKAYIAWSNIGPMDLLPQLAQKYNFKLRVLSQDTGRRGYNFYIYSLKDKEN